MVRTAADMTVRQIISLLFDRVADELGVTATAAAAAAAAHTNSASPAQTGLGGAGMDVNESEAGTEEAVVEEEGEQAGGGGATGQGALRCAHLVFQVRLVRGWRVDNMVVPLVGCAFVLCAALRFCA